MRYLDDDYVHMMQLITMGMVVINISAASVAIQNSVRTFKPRQIARRDYDGETSLSKMAKAPDIIVFEVFDKRKKTLNKYQRITLNRVTLL